MSVPSWLPRAQRVMERICLIVDFDGFQFRDQPFLVRELGFVAMDSDDCGLESFDLSVVPLADERDLSTVRYLRKCVHGLPYHPKFDERARPLDYLDECLLELYDRYRTDSRDLVAYKGGCCEKLKLEELNLPSVNLEVFGCPKFDHLVRVYGCDQSTTCDLHDPGLGGKIFHCSLAEVKAFKRWVSERLREEEDLRQARQDELEGWKVVGGRDKRKKTRRFVRTSL